MSEAESTPRRARLFRGGARTRRVVALAVIGSCSLGLSACRTIGPAGDTKKSAGSAALAVAQSTPVPAAPTATGTPESRSTSPGTVVPTSADVGAGSAPDGASSGVATAPDGTAVTTPATAADGTAVPPQPKKLVVDNPWLVVGRPYVVDTTAPRGTTTGLTGFQLIFRTRGDFRGVRAGTQVTDPRHYKVGLISVPELPAYLPGGPANLRLGDRNKSKGRYCWIATLGKQGATGKVVFPARANGVAMAVEFDLHGAPVQRRTASVFVRQKAGEQPSELQNKLGCHLNYF